MQLDIITQKRAVIINVVKSTSSIKCIKNVTHHQKLMMIFIGISLINKHILLKEKKIYM